EAQLAFEAGTGALALLQLAFARTHDVRQLGCVEGTRAVAQVRLRCSQSRSMQQVGGILTALAPRAQREAHALLPAPERGRLLPPRLEPRPVLEQRLVGDLDALETVCVAVGHDQTRSGEARHQQLAPVAQLVEPRGAPS